MKNIKVNITEKERATKQGETKEVVNDNNSELDKELNEIFNNELGGCYVCRYKLLP